MNIILFDIETTPIEAYTWTKWLNGPVVRVKQDWRLLCFAQKSLGSEITHVFSRRNYTERQLVKRLHTLFMEADVLIAHNGDSFDIKKANAKFIQYGLKPVPPKSSVDTRKLAKQSFAFTGNSLDELGHLLGVGRKMKHSGFELWEQCMAGNVAALKHMEKYNKQDVLLLEKIYNKLIPWAKNPPNLALLGGKPDACPKCGDGRLQARGVRYAKTRVYKRYMCRNCWGWCYGTKALGVTNARQD